MYLKNKLSQVFLKDFTKTLGTTIFQNTLTSLSKPQKLCGEIFLAEKKKTVTREKKELIEVVWGKKREYLKVRKKCKEKAKNWL